ncbi:MAG: exo-alpha-sialidase [Acidobacteria bacterium]|nr:exo-alpha-sialidase [Acidobacteriota bacterium]
MPSSPLSPVPLTRLSTDTFTNTSSQHATEVEPGAFAFGSTIVTAFQVGRIFAGGGADIGFATSMDGGGTWNNGFLPGITVFQGAGPFTAASDPVVAFDAKHGLWLISLLALGRTNTTPANAVVISWSRDGISWSNWATDPIEVSHTADADKDWIVCDNGPPSPNYGNCYVEWDDPSQNANDLIWMSVSNDGGQTWQTAQNTQDGAHGLGGVPVVERNGTVIVPIMEVCTTQSCAPSILSFSSLNGGGSWSSTTRISTISDHQVAGNLRSDPLPAAQVDGDGTVYVVWQDCRFRVNCSSNDLVLSASPNGTTWTALSRIPIDPTSSTFDHFIPGLGIDPMTSGSSAHLALTFYFYPNAACGASTCQLEVGFISSADGGQTWASPTTLTIPMSLAWLPNTFSGVMVGDYIATVLTGGKALPIFALANAPPGTQPFDEAIYTTSSPLAVDARARRFTSAGEHPVPGAGSDHAARQFYDLEHRYPVVPPK